MARTIAVLLLICSLAPTAFAARHQIDEVSSGSPEFVGTYNNHRYFIVDWGTVADARAAANAIGASENAPAYLATLNNAEEEAWIRENLLAPEEQLWIGFSDEVTEGTFVWDNGEPVTYTHWVLAEPTDFGYCPTRGNYCQCEDHVTLNGHPGTGGGWNDLAGDCWVFRGLVEVEAPTNNPPDCGAAVASEPVLWPPNHAYHRISILGVTDPEGNPMTITVTGVTQDEPPNADGDGNTCPDAQIVKGVASLRAERTGQGDGRVYAISFIAEDSGGGSCAGMVSVCVPHDQGGPMCLDDGQRYNSIEGCTRGSELQAEASGYGLRVGEMAGQLTVDFTVPTETKVVIGVFDLAGRRLATVENGLFAAGTYQRSLNMSAAPKGVYFVRIQAGAQIVARTVLKTR